MPVPAPAEQPRRQRRDIDPRRLRERMVRGLAARGLADDAVLRAMLAVRRDLFVEEALRCQAYEDIALPIGLGQTISQPSTVARMTALLDVRPGMRVLEVGTGSGYQSAVLAALGCRVFTVERLAELCARAQAVFRRLGLTSIRMRCGDGTLGMPGAAPFERIIVTAGGPEVPRPLIEQLDSPGVLLIPVGKRRREQRLIRICRKGGQVLQEDLGPAVFVDLVGSHGW